MKSSDERLLKVLTEWRKRSTKLFFSQQGAHLPDGGRIRDEGRFPAAIDTTSGQPFSVAINFWNEEEWETISFPLEGAQFCLLSSTEIEVTLASGNKFVLAEASSIPKG